MRILSSLWAYVSSTLCLAILVLNFSYTTKLSAANNLHVSHPVFVSHPAIAKRSEYARSSIIGAMNSKSIENGVTQLSIVVPDNRELILVREHLERRGKGEVAWFGVVEDEPDSEVTLTLKRGIVVGRVRVGTDVYELMSTPNKQLTIELLDDSAFPELDSDFVVIEEEPQQSAPALNNTTASEAMTIIDLLIVYSNDALADAGSTAQMEAIAQAAVDAANSAFINSEMTLRYRLVHTQHIDYNTAGTTTDDLYWVDSDPEVANLRNQYGADMVSVIVDTPGSCGTGYVQRNPGASFAPWAFQATDIDCAVGNLTFGHEHGHNLGMEHNPENSSATSSSASFPWSFAHYVNGSYRTMMSYSAQCQNGCPRAQQISNPSVIHNGVATGISDQRDNARTGEVTGPISALFRDTVVPIDNSVTFAMLGDFGDGSSASGNVAAQVGTWGLDFIITAGDNRYGSNSFDTVIGQFYCDFVTDVTSGPFCAGGNSDTNAFFPSPGNHDYTDGLGINEYLSYFTLPGSGVPTSSSSGNERYYDFIQGPVHFFSIDSHNARNSSTDMAQQKAWLQAQLAASTSPWQVVFFHHAAFSSSSNHGSDPSMQWPFSEWGADAVFAGHDHIYERIIRNGIPYFVNGLGGRSLYGLGDPIIGSEIQYNGDYGAMRIFANNSQMLFEFITRNGVLIDSYAIPAMETNFVSRQISSGSDDVEESLADGSMYINSSDIELGDDPASNGDQIVGLRFNNITIPHGSTIDLAYLEFSVDETSSAATDVQITIQADDNAPAFTSTTFNVSSRIAPATPVNWSIPAWNSTGDSHTSPDINTLVQSVINRVGWNSGNSLVLMIEGTGTRTAEAYEGVPHLAARLYIEYSDAPENTPPNADFDWTPNGLTVNFSDMSSDSDGSVTAWQWNFDDGGSSTNQNPARTYASSGTYDVSLMVTDNDGASDITNQEVTVLAPNTPPTAAFSETVDGLQADFTDLSTDSDGSIVSWSWNFGDGSSSGNQNPSHTYAASGTYTVSLLVTDNSNETNSTSRSVSVSEPVATPPAAPTNLVATKQTQGKGRNKVITGASLTWVDNSNNETNFVIEHCLEQGKGKNKTCSYSELATVPENTTQYDFVPTDSDHRYRVKATNSSGDSAYSNSVKL